MPIKPIAELRTRFEHKDVPTPQDWIDLVDTMLGIKEAAEVAITAQGPVQVVADQDERLDLPKEVAVGSRVKQTDNGVTYVKQKQDGDEVGDWEAIGDAAIVMDDVAGLQAALDTKMINYDWDQTTGDISAKNYYLNNISVNTSGVDTVVVPIPGPAFDYAFRGQNFTISVSPVGSPDPVPEGCGSTVAIANTSMGDIEASLAAGFRVFGSPFPVTIPSGKWLMVSVTVLPNPGYGGSPPFYFIGYALEG